MTHKNDRADAPILVISHSFGGGKFNGFCDGSQSAMAAAAQNAVSAGITVVVSSGNDGYCSSISSPACLEPVISVGAVYDANLGDKTHCLVAADTCQTLSTNLCTDGRTITVSTMADQVTPYSNVASFLTVFGPSDNAATADITGSDGYGGGDFVGGFNGTSAACPYVAGAVAVLQQARKTTTGSYFTPAQIKSLLASTGDNVTDTKVAVTKPRINLGNALLSFVETQVVTLGSVTLPTEGCLPGNGVLDPNEPVTVALGLKNLGTTPTANLVATLLTRGGVTAPSGPQSYAGVPDGGAEVVREFSFIPTGVCGGTVTAIWSLVDGPINHMAITNVFILGQPNSLATNTYTVAAVNVPIGTNAGPCVVEIPFVVPTAGLIADVNVRIRQHSGVVYGRALRLVHPDGTSVPLSGRLSWSNQVFGLAIPGCADMGLSVRFDDAALDAWASSDQPTILGSYRPVMPLAALNGKNQQGTWKLVIADDQALSAGTNYCAQLEIATLGDFSCCVIAPRISRGTVALTAETHLPTNGAVDATEAVTVRLPLTNFGNGPTLNLTATLQAGGGVTAPSSAQTYGVLAASGGTATQSFSFVASGICGQTITGIWSLADAGQPLGAVTNIFLVGKPTGIAVQSYSSGVAHPVGATGGNASLVEIPLVVPDAGYIDKVVVKFRQHAGQTSGRALRVVHPDGTSVTLLNPTAFDGNSFGFGSTDCDGRLVAFDDADNEAINPNELTIQGRFRPVQSLAVFRGKSPQGTWKLVVEDSAATTIGTNYCFQLRITTPAEFSCAVNAPVLSRGEVTVFEESCLPTNGAVDPLETVNVLLPITNLGAVRTTNLVATLQAGGGVLNPGIAQSYGALATNGGTASRSFLFTANAACGGVVTAVWSLVDGAVSYPSITNYFHIGQPTSLVTNTYTAELANAEIASSQASAGLVEIPLTVPDIGLIQDLNVKLRQNTGWADGRDLWLIHPDGTRLRLIANHRFYSGSVLGSGSTDCSGQFCIFDDAAASSFTSISSPWVGSFRPATALSAFQGKNMAGTWRLLFDDAYGASAGTNYCFQLEIATQGNRVCCGMAELGLLKSVSPASTTIGNQLTYTLAVTNIGVGSAVSVTVTDALPAQLSFVSASPGLTHAAGVVSGSLGNLAPGQGTNLSIVVSALARGTLVNTAYVASASFEAVTANNRGLAACLIQDVPPSLITQPASTNLCPVGTARFSLTAAGSNLAYQWQKNGADIVDFARYSGTTSNVFSISEVDPSDVANYRCLVSNTSGTVTSAVATLTLKASTIVTVQPVSTNLCGTGGYVKFSVQATGEGTLSYQWFKDDQPLTDGGQYSGTDSVLLFVDNIDTNSAGAYRCQVTGDCGTALSSIATLTLATESFTLSPASFSFGAVPVGSSTSTVFTLTNLAVPLLSPRPQFPRPSRSWRGPVSSWRPARPPTSPSGSLRWPCPTTSPRWRRAPRPVLRLSNSTAGALARLSLLGVWDLHNPSKTGFEGAKVFTTWPVGAWR